jgi:methylmalonyl-CoA carboxyltransferase large subunit
MVKVSQILEELQAKLAKLEATNEKLEARIKELEQPAKAQPLPVAAPVASSIAASVPVPVSQPELVSEEIMLVLAAAVAAYLGERAHIRVVRLVPSHAWAQQGRVSIQASHQLV